MSHCRYFLLTLAALNVVFLYYFCAGALSNDEKSSDENAHMSLLALLTANKKKCLKSSILGIYY